MATELGTAYVSILGETSKLEDSVKKALAGTGKAADKAGRDIGERMSRTASKAMKDGWRPDQDIMAGIPNTKLDRVGARIGQVIGKGVVGGLKAKEAGSKFAHSFADGAGSIGVGRIISSWRGQLSGGALNSMGMLAGKAFSAGLTAAIGVGVAGAGIALSKGFNRLVTIDTAKYKLKALGKSTEEVADIVKTVTDSVTGTPFALDQAFATATQAIGAGTKDLKRFMTDVADAAGFAGVGIDRMGLIFNQIQAKGKLTGEEMMQLMEAGLPAKSWIQDSYQMTADQFDKMQKDGEITMDMLQKSIEDHAGGMSKKLGETLQGSIDNMQTAIARVGANFLSAVFGGEAGDDTEKMKDAINRITEYLNRMGNWVNAHREDIREFFNSAVDAAKGLAEILGKVLGFLKEHPGAIQAVVVAFAAWEAIKGISTVASAIAGINSGLRVMPGLANSALGPVSALAAALAAASWARSQMQWGNGEQVGAIPGPADFTPGRRSGAEILLGPFAGTWLDRNFGAGSSVGGNIATGGPMVPGTSANAADQIIGGLLGGGGNVTGGSSLGGVPGTAGRGYFNSNRASAYLDAQTFDAALLSRVPSGAYSQTQAADLTQGLADCSSAIEDLVNLMDGMPTSGRSMTTGNAAQWLTSRGFLPGTMPGAFNVGFNSSHMQATLPGGTPFNWGSKAAAARGGVGGTGAFDPAFTQHFYRPFSTGGGVRGPGSSRSDSIPAMLSNGEHVLSAKDVSAMGGQNKVYGFRKALHRANGGAATAKIVDDMFNPNKTGPGGDIGRSGSGTPKVPFIWGDWGNGIISGPKAGIRGPMKDLETWFPWWWNGWRADPTTPGGKIRKNMKLLGFANGGAVDRKFLEDMRTAGAIPAAAGSTAKAGESAIAGAIDMGGEVINAVIDQAASAVATAASAAATAGSMGAGGGPLAGQAAGSATQFAIGLGTNAAKRGVTYGFDLLGIGADALLQQLTPFGQPRWLNEDYTGFMPNWDINGALGDLMTSGATQATQAGLNMQGAAVDPNTMQHGMSGGTPPGPAMFQNTASSFLSTEFGSPETPLPVEQQPVFKVDNIYTTDAQSVGRELSRQGRLAQMQYTGRPGM